VVIITTKAVPRKPNLEFEYAANVVPAGNLINKTVNVGASVVMVY